MFKKECHCYGQAYCIAKSAITQTQFLGKGKFYVFINYFRSRF